MPFWCVWSVLACSPVPFCSAAHPSGYTARLSSSPWCSVCAAWWAVCLTRGLQSRGLLGHEGILRGLVAAIVAVAIVVLLASASWCIADLIHASRQNVV